MAPVLKLALALTGRLFDFLSVARGFQSWYVARAWLDFFSVVSDRLCFGRRIVVCCVKAD